METALNRKAMLVYLRMSMWTGRKKDKDVTAEILRRKNSENDSGAWWTYLVPAKALRAVDTAYHKCRNVHYKLTLPWMDGGLRILPSAMFMEYGKAMREVTAEYDVAVDSFIKDYPILIADARKRLGDLLNGAVLPTAAEIKHKFKVSQDILPMPVASDFRVELAQEDLNEMKKNLSVNIESMTSKAMTDLWGRLSELIEKIEKTLGDPNKKFKNSLIDNLGDFCKLIPKMNITGSKELEKMRKEVFEKLAVLHPDNLRKFKRERKQAHKDAKDVLKKMKAYTS